MAADWGDGIIVLSRERKLSWKKPAVVIRQKPKPQWRPHGTSTEERLLKTKLKISRGTGTIGKDGLEMLEGLPQGIGVLAGRRGLFPTKPGAQHFQPPVQSAPQPVDRFQGKGHPQFFRRRLERKSRQ
jgi:hypothetical protein